MRQKRAKSYRKQLLVYNYTFKFRQPYQVLVDDLIVTDASNSKFDLEKGLKRTLQADIKVMITQCCMEALYKTGDKSAIALAKRFERRRCNHNIKDPEKPVDCIKSIVDINGENKHRYIVASQNLGLRRYLRRIPGVPLIHISRSVMVMEPLSTASARVGNKMEQDKLFKGLNDPESAGRKTLSGNETEDGGATVPKKRKGPKGPNPLSVKKSKKHKGEGEVKENGNDGESTTKRRRRRKHKKSGDRSGPVEQAEEGDVDEAVEETKHTGESVNDGTAKGESNSTGASSVDDE